MLHEHPSFKLLNTKKYLILVYKYYLIKLKQSLSFEKSK